MPWPVRWGRPGHLVAGPEAGVGDHLARGGVHRLARRADLRGGERRGLRLLLEIPHLGLARGRLAEDRRPRDVGLVAVPSSRRRRSGRRRRPSAAAARCCRAGTRCTGRTTRRSRRWRPAAGRRRVMLPPSSPCVMPSRSVASPALNAASVMSFAYCMQRDLRRRLDHPAARRDRRGEHDLRRGRRLRQRVGDEEADALLDADLRGRDAAVLQDAGDERQRIVVFLPDAHVVREPDDLARALLLEGRARRRRALPSPE